MRHPPSEAQDLRQRLTSRDTNRQVNRGVQHQATQFFWRFIGSFVPRVRVQGQR